jgi:hypothetical protein
MSIYGDRINQTSNKLATESPGSLILLSYCEAEQERSILSRYCSRQNQFYTFFIITSPVLYLGDTEFDSQFVACHTPAMKALG